MNAQNKIQDVNGNPIQAGDSIEWCNGPIIFREMVFPTPRGLAVRGVNGPILVSRILLPVQLVRESAN
jgi:hypothetical protein